MLSSGITSYISLAVGFDVCKQTHLLCSNSAPELLLTLDLFIYFLNWIVFTLQQFSSSCLYT